MTHLELQNHFQVGAWDLGRIVGPERLFVQQSAAGDTVRKQLVHWAGLAIFGSPANPKPSPFEQPDKSPAETQEVSGANHELPQELVEISNRAQLRQNVQELVQFMSLSARSCVQFSIRDCGRSKSGHGRKQRLLLLAESALALRG